MSESAKTEKINKLRLKKNKPLGDFHFQKRLEKSFSGVIEDFSAVSVLNEQPLLP